MAASREPLEESLHNHGTLDAREQAITRPPSPIAPTPSRPPPALHRHHHWASIFLYLRPAPVYSQFILLCQWAGRGAGRRQRTATTSPHDHDLPGLPRPPSKHSQSSPRHWMRARSVICEPVRVNEGCGSAQPGANGRLCTRERGHGHRAHTHTLPAPSTNTPGDTDACMVRCWGAG